MEKLHKNVMRKVGLLMVNTGLPGGGASAGKAQGPGLARLTPPQTQERPGPSLGLVYTRRLRGSLRAGRDRRVSCCTRVTLSRAHGPGWKQAGHHLLPLIGWDTVTCPPHSTPPPPARGLGCTCGSQRHAHLTPGLPSPKPHLAVPALEASLTSAPSHPGRDDLGCGAGPRAVAG